MKYQKPSEFEIDEPEKYQCKVLGYVSSQSKLMIKMTHIETKSNLYLLLMDVVYFSGVMEWKGANLNIGSSEKKFEILELISNFNIETEAKLQEYQLICFNPLESNFHKDEFRVIASLYSVYDYHSLADIFDNRTGK